MALGRIKIICNADSASKDRIIQDQILWLMEKKVLLEVRQPSHQPPLTAASPSGEKCQTRWERTSRIASKRPSISDGFHSPARPRSLPNNWGWTEYFPTLKQDKHKLNYTLTKVAQPLKTVISHNLWNRNKAHRDKRACTCEVPLVRRQEHRWQSCP